MPTLATMRFTAFALVAAIPLAAPPVATAAISHLVEPGESLSSVAASDGLSVEQLAATNGLSPEASLLAGSTLTIPAANSAAEQSGETPGETAPGDEAEPGESGPDEASPSSPEGGAYVVQPGDTLSQLAAREGMSVEALAALNGIDPNAPLPAGVALRVPGAAAERTVAAEGGQASSGEGAGEQPYTTRETVTPSEVGSIAAEQGVPPSLAEAIAEQESGFDNGLTSNTNARGVMQIEPETWSWINRNLAGATPLEPASARSNVRGGVLLLHWLLSETEGDPAQAAAGYYQGLESVRQEGEAPETEQYVSSVLSLKTRFGGE